MPQERNLWPNTTDLPPNFVCSVQTSWVPDPRPKTTVDSPETEFKSCVLNSNFCVACSQIKSIKVMKFKTSG